MTERSHFLSNLADIDLRLLRVFTTIVDCGGVTPAEAELNMANSTLSTHLATLEDRLQMKLCQRGRAGFGLTPQGRQVYDAAQKMFQSLDEFRRSVQTAHSAPPAALRILAPDAMFCTIIDELVPVFRRLLTLQPKVFIDIDLASPATIDKCVIEGKVDIGINSSSRRTHNLRFYDIKEEVVALYCGSGHPLHALPKRAVTLEKISQHEVVRAEGYYYPKKVLRAIQGTRSASCLPLDGRAMLLATGRYLGLLPEEFALPYVERGLLRELMPEEFRYSNRISVITRANVENPTVSRFLEILDDEIRARP